MDFLKKLAALFFGVAVSLAAAEWIVSRFGAVDTPPGLYQPSSTRQFEHHPGFRGRDRNYNRIQINSLGLRSPEISVEKPSGVYRVLVIGDSVAFADGIQEEDGFCRQMEVSLRARGKNVEVINAGVRGYNTRSEAFMLSEVGVHLHPDLVILAYVLNDAEPLSKQEGLLNKEGAAYRLKQWVKDHFYLYSFFRRIVELGRHRVTPGQFVENYDAQFAPGHPGWADSLAALKEIRDTAAAAKAELLVAVLPRLEGLAPGEVYPAEAIQRQVVEASRGLGIETLDILPVLKGHPESKLKIRSDDTFHPNREGHGLIAAALEQAVLSKLSKASEAKP